MIAASVLIMPQLIYAESPYYLAPIEKDPDANRPCVYVVNTDPCITPDKMIYYVSLVADDYYQPETKEISSDIIAVDDQGDKVRIYLKGGDAYYLEKNRYLNVKVGSFIHLSVTTTKPVCEVKEMTFFNGTSLTNFIDVGYVKRVDQQIIDSIYEDPSKYGYVTSFPEYPQFNMYLEDQECQTKTIVNVLN